MSAYGRIGVGEASRFASGGSERSRRRRARTEGTEVTEYLVSTAHYFGVL